MRWISLPVFFLALSLVVALAGCQRKSAHTHRDAVILSAYRLIDAQRTDEAIQLLENAIANAPARNDFRVVLASAYAHKAGIRIQKFVPLFNQTTRIKKLIRSQTKSRSLPKDPSARVDTLAKATSSLMTNLSGFMEVYSDIPAIDAHQSIFLIQAISTLNEIGNELKPTDAVYRAMLEIVLLKFEIATDLLGDAGTNGDSPTSSCQINTAAVSSAASETGHLLIDIFNDLGFANPKSAAQMRKLANETADLTSRVTLLTTSVTDWNDSANIFLKQTAIQAGFGKILKCGAGL